MNFEDRRAKFEETALNAIRSAIEAIDSPNVEEADKVVLRVSVETLVKCYEIIRRISAKLLLDESELAVDLVNAIIGITNANITIGVSGYRTVGARRFVQNKQAELARSGLIPEREKRKRLHDALLHRHVQDIDEAKRHPSKTAEAIRDAVNADLKADGKQAITARTIQRWINDLSR